MKQILVIDDHEVVRVGLKHLVKDILHGATWVYASNTQEALHLSSTQDWDLVTLELSLDGNRGLELLKDIKRLRPKAPILVITSYPEHEYAFRAFKAGASGYFSKTGDSAELITAVTRVLDGGRYLSVTLAEALSADLDNKSRPEAIHELLSDREFQVLRAIGSGKTVGEIAVSLALSSKTVSTYRARILDKTGLKNNAALVRYVVEHGLAD